MRQINGMNAQNLVIKRLGISILIRGLTGMLRNGWNILVSGIFMHIIILCINDRWD